MARRGKPPLRTPRTMCKNCNKAPAVANDPGQLCKSCSTYRDHGKAVAETHAKSQK
jgi:hypothetical protein